jgi:type I restriction enzyme, S subunit
MSIVEAVPLGQIADLRAGFGFPRELQGKQSGDYPFAKVGDISRQGRSAESILWVADHYVNESDLAVLKAKPVPQGSILFAKIGEAIRQNHRVIAGCALLIDNNAMAAVPRQNVDGRYLYEFLRTVDLYPIASSTTVPSLRKSDLERIVVPLPPLPEQRRIAEVLDRAEALRAKRQAGLARLDELTRAIFHEIFGDPVTNSMGWTTVQLKDLLEIPLRNGQSPSKLGQIIAKVLTLSAVTGEEFDAGAWKESTFSTVPPAEQSVSETDLLVCRGNGNLNLVGKGYFPPAPMPDVTFPDTIIAARIGKSRAIPAYVQQVWNSAVVRKQIQAGARTTNGTHKVNQGVLERIEFVLPPLALQSEFARRAAAVERLRAAHRAALAELDALFASLQYRAFRGEL